MKVTVDQHRGILLGCCADDRHRRRGRWQDGSTLFSLGPIIHNPDGNRPAAGAGAGDGRRTTISNALRGQTVLIRAHGEPPSTYDAPRRHGITLIDATCPVVTKVQERIRKFYDQGYQIVIFGKKDHAEVIGLVGHTNNEAVVIKSVEEVAKRRPGPEDRAVLPDDHGQGDVLRDRRASCARRSRSSSSGPLRNPRSISTRRTRSADRCRGATRNCGSLPRQTTSWCLWRAGIPRTGRCCTISAGRRIPRTHFIEHESELQPEWFDGRTRSGSAAPPRPRSGSWSE